MKVDPPKNPDSKFEKQHSAEVKQIEIETQQLIKLIRSNMYTLCEFDHNIL